MLLRLFRGCFLSPAKDPKEESADKCVKLGCDALKVNDRDTARLRFLEALQYSPHHSYALSNLSLLYPKPETPGADHLLTITLPDGSRPTQREILKRAILSDPANPYPKINLAALMDRAEVVRLTEEEEGSGAKTPVELCLDAIRIDSKLAAAYNTLGARLPTPDTEVTIAGKKYSAKALFQRAVDLDKNYADAYNNLGGVCSGEEAQAAFIKAITLDPHHILAICNLAASLNEDVSVTLPTETAALFKKDLIQKALKIDPNHPMALTSLADTVRVNIIHVSHPIYGSMSRQDVLIRVLEADPSNGRAYFLLGNELDRGRKVNIGSHREMTAEEVCVAAVHYARDIPETYLALARCLHPGHPAALYDGRRLYKHDCYTECCKAVEASYETPSKKEAMVAMVQHLIRELGTTWERRKPYLLVMYMLREGRCKFREGSELLTNDCSDDWVLHATYRLPADLQELIFAYL
eukprot:PhF_6_TR32133/c0_g1_i1/m.47576